MPSAKTVCSLVPRPHPQIKRAKGGRVWPKDQVVRGLVEFQEFHIIYSSVTAFSNQCRHLMLDDRACPPCEEMAVKTCCVCGKQLHNCRERRKLHSSATSHVLPVLLQALSSHLHVGSYAGDLDAIAQLLPCGSTYICKNPCFSNLDTLLRMTSQSSRRRLRKGFLVAARTAYRESMPAIASAPPTKRPRWDDKQGKSGTPTRPRPSNRQLLFTRPKPGTSPNVTVR